MSKRESVSDSISSEVKRLKELREFGAVMAIACLVLVSLLLYKGKESFFIFLVSALFFYLPAVLMPRLLTPFEVVWMKFAGVLSVVMTAVIMTITFYGMVTPIGLIRRVFGEDPLSRALDPSCSSYWTDVEVDGPGTRPYTPY